MAIANIANGESGSSARGKLNQSINNLNNKDSIYSLANLYDNTFLVNTFLTTGTGNTSAFTGINCTNFIPIDGLIGISLILSKRPVGVNNAPNIALYDASQNYLGQIVVDDEASIFKITNTDCAFIRFNTKWTTDVQETLSIRIAEPKNGNFFNSNSRFRNTLDGITLSVGTTTAFYDKNAKIDTNNIGIGIEYIAKSNTVTLQIINPIDWSIETQVIVGTIGYNYLPITEVNTALTSYYIGFATGIAYVDDQFGASAFVSAGTSSDRFFLFGYNILYSKQQKITDFQIAALSGNGKISGEYTVNSTIVFPPNFKLEGNNCLVNTGASAKFIFSHGASLSNINFIGTRSTSLNAYTTPLIVVADLPNYATYIDKSNSLIEIGHLSSEQAYNVSRCSFKDIDKNVINCLGGNFTAANTPVIDNNKFINCKSVSTNAEYMSYNNNSIFNCTYGLIIIAGNTYMNGNEIHNCSCGVVIDDQINGSHGSIVGGCINHSSVASIYAKRIKASEVINGLNLFEGPVLADDAEGMAFIGCILDTYFIITTGKTNMIVASMFRTAYQDGNPFFTDTSSSLSLKNNLIQNAIDQTPVNN